MRRYDGDELAGCDDLGLFPEFWEMALVAGDQIVGAGGVGAFNKNVVVRIFRDPDRTCGGNELRSIFDELEKFVPKAASDFEFRAREDFTVIGENGLGDIQPGWFGEREEKYGALESVRVQSRGNDDVGVDDQAEGNHRRPINVASIFLVISASTFASTFARGRR